MSVKVPERDLIVLDGHCPSEDAENLLQRLLVAPAATVDLRTCEELHTAVIQVLLAAAPVLRLPPGDDERARRLAGQLQSAITP
jgi:hypothetical protein